jgi:hypothetical protein
MLRPSGIVPLSALVLAISLLVASDGQAGSALVPPMKTTGISMTATIVIDVTQTTQLDAQGKLVYISDAGTGATSIRVQKASQSTAAIFSSGYIRGSNWTLDCLKPEFTDLQQSTAFRFTGYIDTLIGDETILNSLFLKFGVTPHNAAIISQDYVVCNTVGDRRQLSFSAVIQVGTGFGP